MRQTYDLPESDSPANRADFFTWPKCGAPLIRTKNNGDFATANEHLSLSSTKPTPRNTSATSALAHESVIRGDFPPPETLSGKCASFAEHPC